MQVQIRTLSVLMIGGLASLLGGCATITGDGTQIVHIETLDENGHPVEGMRCHASNASSDYFGDSPMFDLEVHRSASDLKVSCRLGERVAEGKAVSRSGLRGGITGVANLVMPGGSGLMVIDHLTGYRYTYPSWIRLQIGRNLVFDASDQVADQPVPAEHDDSEPHPQPAQAPAAPARPTGEPALARASGPAQAAAAATISAHEIVRSD